MSPESLEHPEHSEQPAPQAQVLVLMGVTGCGKSTVAALLAGALRWDFEEGDALHPRANVEKMASGHPLTDEDRWPWLEKVAAWIEGRLDAGKNGVITCSSLKRSYRDVLNRRGTGVVFVYLQGSQETIAARLAVRRGHFMPPALLASQFETLEEPQPDEPHLTINVGPAPKEIAREIIDALKLKA
ncbi:gluconokinase [Arthrobacter sp. I2-34]|uniref:Gluconokinase n=1 Tax=Arthrobacter hankyongi TaxID=2904801 RepID=A0ABS9L2M9_9MICC|nr:gluconokinase [Arthrobacter hankyongi]MCG2620903.1 gluconokinase [Arthrobacter hankyongi]